MYRKLFNLSHDQYLDEPGEAVQWMLRIDRLYQEDEARREKANKPGV